MSRDKAERIKELEELRDEVDAAIVKVLGGQSYSLGTRSVTRADLSELRAMRKDLDDEIDLLEDSGSTHRRFRRVIPWG